MFLHKKLRKPKENQYLIPQTVLALWGSQFVLRSVACAPTFGGRRWDPSWDPSAETLKNLTKTNVFAQQASKT